MKSVASLFNVETDRVDNPVGTGNGCLHGALVTCVRSDLFDSSVPAQLAMTRDYAHPGAVIAQMAHDTTANKAGPSKHDCAAHSLILQMIPCDALDCPVQRGTHCFSGFGRGATSIDMMRNDVDQNLRCRADSLPLLFRFVDQRFGFSVQFFRLLDDRSCSIEKINQRLGRWQGFLNLLKLCVAKAGNVADYLNEPVLQHFLTSLTPSRASSSRMVWLNADCDTPSLAAAFVPRS